MIADLEWVQDQLLPPSPVQSEDDGLDEFLNGIHDTVQALHLSPYSPHFEKFSDGQRVLMAQKLREAADKIDASAVSPQ